MSGRNVGKRVLILWADDTSTNLGVRVLAEGSAQLVRRAWPDAEIVFHTFGNSSPELPMGRLRTLVRERVTGKRGTLEWLAGFDLVVDTRAGDSFADIYGLRRLRIMSAIAELATQAGTPVVMAPQTIGPFNSRQGLAIGRHSMRRAAATMARDSVSADYAASVGRPVDLLTTDVVFALPTPTVTKGRDVLLNVSGLLWQESPHVDAAAYRAIVTDLYHALTASGRTVGLLAHVLDSSNADNDVPALHEFQRTVGSDLEVVIPKDLGEVREAVAEANVVIGSRMHACLNALSVGTPAIPLAYSRKFQPLLGDLGLHRTVDLRTDAADAVSRVMGHLDAPELVSETVDAVTRAHSSLNGVVDLVRSSGRAVAA